MSTIGTVTHWVCPATGQNRDHHHLVPVSGVMTCVYCRKDEATIRADHAQHRALIARMHDATTIDSAAGGAS